MNLEYFLNELFFSHSLSDGTSVLYKDDLFLPHSGCMNLVRFICVFIYSIEKQGYIT